MTAQLHELLAARKTATTALDGLTKDTQNKFAKVDSFFTGFTKTLSMSDGEDPASKKLEDAARQDKALPTTVVATLEYYGRHWANAEDVLFQTNLTNTRAVATLEFRGAVLKEGVPVDELLGLEQRLTDLRGLLTQVPTLDASKEWKLDTTAAQAGTWKAIHQLVTTKTEKTVKAIVLYPHSDKHPAQVEKLSDDKVVGAFYTDTISGATTALQKANMLATIDELIIEVKKARTRANSVDVVNEKIGKTLIDLIFAPLYSAPANNQV
jgi:hypothetical protein